MGRSLSLVFHLCLVLVPSTLPLFPPSVVLDCASITACSIVVIWIIYSNLLGGVMNYGTWAPYACSVGVFRVSR